MWSCFINKNIVCHPIDGDFLQIKKKLALLVVKWRKKVEKMKGKVEIMLISISFLFFSRFRCWFNNHHYLIITHLNLCSVGELCRWNLSFSFRKSTPMNSSDALKFVIYIISNKNLLFCNRPQYQNPPKTNNAFFQLMHHFKQ